tara:strand:- start:479 stop:715 length:237 start_codon:yes stop_codon:yes gene_type:complete
MNTHSAKRNPKTTVGRVASNHQSGKFIDRSSRFLELSATGFDTSHAKQINNDNPKSYTISGESKRLGMPHQTLQTTNS